MTTPDYSLDSLKRFLAYVSDKGLMNKATSENRSRAVNLVFSTLDDSEKKDLRSLDLTEFFRRFGNLRGMDFKSSSLSVYESRVRGAVKDFLAFVDDPKTFKPSAVPRAAKTIELKSSRSTSPSKVQLRQAVDSPEALITLSTVDRKLIFPVPIRADHVVELVNLPSNLTKGEAERICAVVRALAVSTD